MKSLTPYSPANNILRFFILRGEGEDGTSKSATLFESCDSIALIFSSISRVFGDFTEVGVEGALYWWIDSNCMWDQTQQAWVVKRVLRCSLTLHLGLGARDSGELGACRSLDPA